MRAVRSSLMLLAGLMLLSALAPGTGTATAATAAATAAAATAAARAPLHSAIGIAAADAGSAADWAATL